MGGIFGDLRLQGVEPRKLAFGPQKFDQRHPQMAAVEVAIDVEEMGFEPRHQTADRGPQRSVNPGLPDYEAMQTYFFYWSLAHTPPNRQVR